MVGVLLFLKNFFKFFVCPVGDGCGVYTMKKRTAIRFFHFLWLSISFVLPTSE